MNKLKLDEDGISFLESLIPAESEIKLDCNLSLYVLTNLKSTYHDDDVRRASARACKALIVRYNEKANEFFDKIIDLYNAAYVQSEPKLDDLGRKKINPLKDSHSDLRLTLARILVECVPVAPTKSVNRLVTFFVPSAISDRNTKVQETMIEAAIALINEHGGRRTQFMMSTFQTISNKLPKEVDNDNLKKNIILLLGILARHLKPDDPQVKVIITQLIESLNTPSQLVQEAVSSCFSALVESYRKDSTQILKDLSKKLYDGSDYCSRRGAAYGMAGIAKALGLASIKQQATFMRKAIQDSKPNKKIGALIGIEVFTISLRRLFEPYIPMLVPHMLLCYGDNLTSVRQATEATAKEVMKCLSATGIRMTLPMLLTAIDDDAWRTKVGSVQLLASMGNCAPRQLSICLPSIVPKIIEALTDSHMKVQEASSVALKQLCQAIRNPEISSMSKKIMESLQDPAQKCHECLVAIANLEFKHFIDAASLSLIMPVIQRGFKERSSETRKISAQIIGAFYLLTNQRDLHPYLSSVIPEIKTSIIDPVPEVRAVTATTLGAMVRGSGEDVVVELMPWLMEKLICEDNQVDRSGAAQAISEVVGALGLTKLDSLLEQVILSVDDPNLKPCVKDGYLMLFIYLPMVMKDDFSPYIGLIIGPVLNGLADDVEYVRGTALLAGKRIVRMFASSAVTLLLPELEKGIYDENWRIRHSSVELIGDLLLRLFGLSRKANTDAAEEDEICENMNEAAIIEALGLETRNRVLSGLYMCRSDMSVEVRQAALNVWKQIVGNTPKTLREILPTLFNILLTSLTSNEFEMQQMAARTLGDIVKKLGERVLPEIIPILESGLESNDSKYRQGVCIGLSEIISSTSKEMVSTFVPSLIPTVRRALYDALPEVRVAAAKTFESLHTTLGPKSSDEVLSPLIKQINDPVHGKATLDGIRQMVIVKSRVVLPYILPHLIDHQPVNMKALAYITPVADEALTRYLPKIIPAVIYSLSRKIGTKNEKKELGYAQTIVLSAEDEHGVRLVVDDLLAALKSKDILIRKSSAMLLNGYCREAKLDNIQIGLMLRGFISLYVDEDSQILDIAYDALNCLTLNFDSYDSIEFLPEIRNSIRYAISDLKQTKGIYLEKNKIKSDDIILPGLESAKGYAPLSVVYRETIINGNADKKELALSSLCEIITHSSVNAVEANTMRIAGTIIRILSECVISDKHPSDVKLALLETLISLMKKAGFKMRPFVPQIDQTLRKLVLDVHKGVRLKTEEAIETFNTCCKVARDL